MCRINRAAFTPERPVQEVKVATRRIMRAVERGYLEPYVEPEVIEPVEPPKPEAPEPENTDEGGEIDPENTAGGTEGEETGDDLFAQGGDAGSPEQVVLVRTHEGVEKDRCEAEIIRETEKSYIVKNENGNPRYLNKHRGWTRV